MRRGRGLEGRPSKCNCTGTSASATEQRRTEMSSRGACDPVTLRARQDYSLPTEKPSVLAPSPLFRVLRLLIDVRPEEVAALAWSWLYFFSILSAYYVIRPIRDEIGAAGGIEKLPWLFTGTLIGMLVANPPFAALVSRLAPVRFISWTYRFFMANLVLFLILFATTTGEANVWAGRVFYIWGAVFNLLVEHLGAPRLLLVSALLLEVAVFAVRRLAMISRGLREHSARHTEETVVGGSVLSGFVHALRSPYLLNLTVYMLLFTVLSTFLYFQQADVARHSFADRAARTAFFANIDLAVNVLTLVIQLFLTGRIIRGLGVALTLTLLPALSMVGFFVLGLTPTLWTVVVFQVLRRAGNFAVARPTRETCFTVVPREDKYKAKSFIDTFVYRTGDQIGAWSYAAMGFLGLGLAGISLAAVPISLVWLLNGLWLGRRNEALTREARGVESAAPLTAR